MNAHPPEWHLAVNHKIINFPALNLSPLLLFHVSRRVVHLDGDDEKKRSCISLSLAVDINYLQPGYTKYYWHLPCFQEGYGTHTRIAVSSIAHVCAYLRRSRLILSVWNLLLFHVFFCNTDDTQSYGFRGWFYCTVLDSFPSSMLNWTKSQAIV